MQSKIILALACLLLGACSFKDFRFGLPGVYRIDIPQGNIVNQEMVDKLKPGMTRRQVRFVMGTPLIIDTFEHERWDYLHSLETKKDGRTQERISLYFKDDKLERITGDLAPAAAGTEAAPEAPATTAPAAETPAATATPAP